MVKIITKFRQKVPNIVEGIPLDMSNHDEMVEVRNTIANELWEKYTSRRANRGARV